MSPTKKAPPADGKSLPSKRAQAHQKVIDKRLAARAAKPTRGKAKPAPAVPQADPSLHPPRTPGFVTWCDLLLAELHARDETMADIVASWPAGTDWLHVEFKPRAWDSEGCPFTVWTKSRVYFPVTDCLSEWVGSVPRAPNDEATRHQGVEL